MTLYSMDTSCPHAPKHGLCNSDARNKRHTSTGSIDSLSNTTDEPLGSLGCGTKYAGGDKGHLGGTSQRYAALAVRNTVDRCRCNWPSVTHGPPSGQNGGRGGTIGCHTPSCGGAPQRTTKSGCAHPSLSPRPWWTPSHNRSAIGSAHQWAFGRSKASRHLDAN